MASLNALAAVAAGPHMDAKPADQRLRGRDIGLILVGRGLGIDVPAAGWTAIRQGCVKHFAGLCRDRPAGLAAIGGARSTAGRTRSAARFTLRKRSSLAFCAATGFLQEPLQAGDVLVEKPVLAAEPFAVSALPGGMPCRRAHALLLAERGSTQRLRKSSRLMAEMRSTSRHQRR